MKDDFQANAYFFQKIKKNFFQKKIRIDVWGIKVH
jgi:hypothetical protein